MSSDKKPVEHLQAKPYNPNDRPSERLSERHSAKQQSSQQSSQQRRHQRATAFFVRQQSAGGRRNPFLGYLLLFLMTALLATAFLFGFIVLLVLFAVLLPIWLVVRFARGTSTHKGAP